MATISYLDAVLVAVYNCEQILEFSPRRMELSSSRKKEQVVMVIRNVPSRTLATLILWLVTNEIPP